MTEIIRRHPGPSLSRVVEYGNLVFVAGTTADNKSASCRAQTEEILKKIDGYLAEAGTSKSKILSANVWVADMKEKAEAYPTLRTRSIVCSKSASVSPGKPTMKSPDSAMSGRAARMRSTSFR